MSSKNNSNNKNDAKKQAGPDREPNLFIRAGKAIARDTDIGFNGPKVRILALAVTIFMIGFMIYNRGLFLDDSNLYRGPLLFTLAILSGPAAGMLIATHIRTKGKWCTVINTIIFFLMPVATMQMIECYNGNFIAKFSVLTFVLNYVAYLFFYLVCLLISGRMHMSVLIVNITLFVCGMINYFVDLFRGSPIVPLDFMTADTGMEVAHGYTLSLSWQLIMGGIIFFLIYLVNKKVVNVRPKRMRFKVLSKVLMAAFIAICALTLMFTNFLTNIGYKPDFWNQERGYHRTGTWLNFCMNLKYLHVAKPEGYDPDNISSILDDMLDQYGVDPDSDTSLNILTGKNDYKASKKQPNIICIMNESWADFDQTIGGPKTNKDYMPFIHSLKKNTIKGTTQVPVFGAGTSNTEFEFLTGNSIEFLPAGSNAYQLYVENFMPSLVSTLGDQGYSKTAFHPYYASGWNRINVYNYMGFQKYTSIEDFVDIDILNTYKKTNDSFQYEQMLKERYPNRNMLLRRFVSDAYDYKMLENMYEKRDKSKPFFLFNVTMQNHGGYAMHYDNFDDTEIQAEGLSGYYPQANRYLSLVKHTDSAFKQLVNYFKNVDEPTIICMFGDHQPSVETAFYEELYGKSLNDLNKKELQTHYTTPFVIWANYDIPEKQLGKVSTNYLSTIVAQLAGSKLTTYQKYLACLYQQLPVLDSVGYIDKNGNYYDYDDKSRYTGTINDYQCVEYNEVIDTKNRDLKLFTLSGKDTQTHLKDKKKEEIQN